MKSKILLATVGLIVFAGVFAALANPSTVFVFNRTVDSGNHIII